MDTIFGGEEEEENTFDEEFEPEEQFDDNFDEPEEEEEEELEWESAYKFSEEMLEADGFANMDEFIRKAMMYKINQSPLYRDRIKHGTETMNMVANSFSKIDSLKGSRQDDMNYSEFVEEVKAAREVSEELDRLGGKEDAIVQEALGLGNEVVNVMKERAASPNTGNVETSVEHTEEEI